MRTNILLYVFCVLTWGSTWFAIDYQLGRVAPVVSLVYRYLLATVVLFAYCGLYRRKLRFSLRRHAWFASLGILLFGLNYVLTYTAQVYISSALNAIAFSTMLIMNIINTRLFFATRIGGNVYVGAGLGIAGIGVLFAPGLLAAGWWSATGIGLGLCLGGTAVASFGNMLSKSLQDEGVEVVSANTWGMAYGTLFLFLWALISGESFSFDPQWSYIASLLYLSIFGSVLAFGAYLTLLGRIGPHKAGYAVVMFPLVALLLSSLFQGFHITLGTVLGVILVLGGNVLVLATRRNLGALWKILCRLRNREFN